MRAEPPARALQRAHCRVSLAGLALGIGGAGHQVDRPRMTRRPLLPAAYERRLAALEVDGISRFPKRRSRSWPSSWRFIASSRKARGAGRSTSSHPAPRARCAAQLTEGGVCSRRSRGRSPALEYALRLPPRMKQPAEKKLEAPVDSLHNPWRTVDAILGREYGGRPLPGGCYQVRRAGGPLQPAQAQGPASATPAAISRLFTHNPAVPPRSLFSSSSFLGGP